ncbi:reverse transcriptase [Phytophthora megakarya]|uniref:Reverse transcriptase n=1 Tax=Phytophthora megakarya TaxID=4795 RepID=A0A225WFC7_9STRA|nr:reverse transcriptase [Phytophthora megakarya]
MAHWNVDIKARRETHEVVSRLGYSPGNIHAERQFQIVSMDFVIPLPKSRWGNTALPLFQCAFTGFVIAKPMSDSTAFKVAQVFVEFIYRRFGAPSLIRHDRDPRFMSEVFQAFAEMMQSRSRATMGYRSQANEQQERSVKTEMQSRPTSARLGRDCRASSFRHQQLNRHYQKRNTFLLSSRMGCQLENEAMTTSLRHGTPKQSEALTWRREVNRQQEVA